MSLHEDIIQLAVEEHGFARLPGNYRALDEIINKVLDAVSMECIPGNIDDGNDYLKGWNQALDHTQSVINKLRPES